MIPENIRSKMGRNLYKQVNHPLQILKEEIYKHFAMPYYENFLPIVTVEANFDSLLIPKDHPSRSFSDTYYVDSDRVLRTHTSAHQTELLRSGHRQFIVAGDVYRRDEIDRFHYPVFHQMEGVSLDYDADNLKDILSRLVSSLFGDINYRFVDSYFPFTQPSWELEIEWNGKWVEVAGLGMVHQEILKNCGVKGFGWAFGIGLERIAMILFGIPDIRLFWSEDRRFLDQFSGIKTQFIPYSKYPTCCRDIAFWVPDGFNGNDFFELVREHGADFVESVDLLDDYKKGDKRSLCYQIVYRSMDKTLLNDEVNLIQEKIRSSVVSCLGVELR